MCYMSQFEVVVYVRDETSITLANLFMKHDLTKFGLYYLIALNDDTPYKEAFITMYQTLKLNYNIVSKDNHKKLSVEYFHRFL